MIYKRVDNSVAIGSASLKTLAILTGTGGFVSPDNIDREVAKLCMMTEADTKAFALSWQEFLKTKLGTPRELVVRTFVRGLCFGGFTEDEALTCILHRDYPSDCTPVAIVEGETLPSDRYFREAWTWED